MKNPFFLSRLLRKRQKEEELLSKLLDDKDGLRRSLRAQEKRRRKILNLKETKESYNLYYVSIYKSEGHLMQLQQIN